jgi:WD40 repeat protein
MPDEPTRLFLSYGVHDASELAERLRRDLTARGYQVWWDVSSLRAGRPWDEDVPEGLRTSQVVLALLSPHSVRWALDAGNSTETDSVCLDEIAYARGVRKIPIVPVQVVSCEAPFLIYRLHQIDFRRWAESEAAYQAGLNQICAAVTEALHSRKSPERLWGPLPQPWDFTPFILEKRKHFVGREWLFRKIDRWRVSSPQSVLLIVGEPGIGKSATVATLVHENPEGQVLAYHCCRADTPATLEPARFVRSIAAMVSARLEGFSAMLDDPVIKEALDRADTDPASAFEAAILSPLHEAPRPDGNRRYLLIDALDEALAHPKRPTIVEVLAARIKQLPSWVGIVATTRSESDVLRRLGGLPAQILEAEDPKNQDDVRAFLQRRLSESSFRAKAEASGKTLEELATGLLRSSAYNFLFVTTALEAVELGQLRFDEIEKLPPGLSSLYEVFFDRLFRENGVSFQPTCQVLEVVAAAREALTRKQIAAVIGLDAEKELPPLLGRLTAFVPFREGRYTLFHRSLFEWLTGWDAQQDQPFAGPYHVGLREGHKRLADWGWVQCQHGITKEHLYSLKHLPTHFAQAGRYDDLRTLLLNFNWLQTKLEATDPNALIADYDYLAGDEDLRVIQSALQLSAHVLARDPRQLAGQLIGRLLGNKTPSTQVLLKQAAEGKVWPWLQPLTPSLTAPEGSLIRTLEGHTDGVQAVSVTPDGRRAVSGSEDRTVRLWDLEGGAPRTFEGHTDGVQAVSVTPDGRLAVSGSKDHTLRLWDLKSGQALRTFEGHTSWVNAVVVTLDGSRVVSASTDGTLRLWDLESGRALRVLEGLPLSVYEGEERKPVPMGPAAPLFALAVTPDGHQAVSGSINGVLQVWNLETGKAVCTLTGHGDSIRAVVVMPDGRQAVSGSHDHTLRLWDLKTGKMLRVFEGHIHQVYAVAVTAEGHALSGSADATLRLWDLESGRALRTVTGHTGSVTAVAVTVNRRWVVSASRDCTIRLWSLENGPTRRAPEDRMAPVSALAITADGCRAVSGLCDGTLRVWDRGSGQVLHTHRGHSKRISALALTPDSSRAISGSWDNTLLVWDLDSGQTLRTLEGHTELVRAVAVTLDGHRAVSGSDDNTLRVWDLETGNKLLILEGHTSRVDALAVTPDGRRVVSCSRDRTLRVWDLETGHGLRTLEGHHDRIYALALTPNGRRVLSGSRDHTLRLWDLNSGRMLSVLEGHRNTIAKVVVTLDGRRAVSGSIDGTLRVWDLETGQAHRTLDGHSREVRTVALSPDGRRAVSNSLDGTVRLWDLESGEEIATFIGDDDMRYSAFTTDGRTIVAGDGFGRVHFLRLVEADETKPPIGHTKIQILSA